MTLLEVIRKTIAEAYVRNEYNKTQTAIELGVSVRTIRNYINNLSANPKRRVSEDEFDAASKEALT